MKKILFVVILFCLGNSLYSQDMKLGVRVGANISHLTNISEASPLVDYYSGFTANFRVSNSYSFAPDLTHSRQGVVNTIENTTYRIDYVYLTLNNKWYQKEGGFHLMLGPSFNYSIKNENFGDIKTKAFDMSFLFGFGYDFEFGLGVEGRYNMGILNVYNDNPSTTNYSGALHKNRVIQIGLTYNIGIK